MFVCARQDQSQPRLPDVRPWETLYGPGALKLPPLPNWPVSAAPPVPSQSSRGACPYITYAHGLATALLLRPFIHVDKQFRRGGCKMPRGKRAEGRYYIPGSFGPIGPFWAFWGSWPRLPLLGFLWGLLSDT